MYIPHGKIHEIDTLKAQVGYISCETPSGPGTFGGIPVDDVIIIPTLDRGHPLTGDRWGSPGDDVCRPAVHSVRVFDRVSRDTGWEQREEE